MAKTRTDSELLNDLRTAMRAIGSHYHVVELAAERARLAGRDDYAEKLDHVYGRLYWMDHALGTMAERSLGMNPETSTLPSEPRQ